MKIRPDYLLLGMLTALSCYSFYWCVVIFDNPREALIMTAVCIIILTFITICIDAYISKRGY